VPNAQDLVLGANADGPYWRSALEILLYPKGCSFYRPFSHRPDWVTPGLQQELQAGGPVHRALGFVGLRFTTDEPPGIRDTFVPLRGVYAASVVQQGEVHTRFTFDGYVPLEDDHLAAWPTGPNSSNAQGRNLLLGRAADMLRLPIATPALSDLPPSGLWEHLITDERLSAKARELFTGSTMLRCVAVFEHGNERRNSQELWIGFVVDHAAAS
jgi:hypothetical protein